MIKLWTHMHSGCRWNEDLPFPRGCVRQAWYFRNGCLPFLLSAAWPLWFLSLWQGQALNNMFKKWGLFSQNFWNDQGCAKWALALLCKGQNLNLKPKWFSLHVWAKGCLFFAHNGCICHDLRLTFFSSIDSPGTNFTIHLLLLINPQYVGKWT